MSHLSQDRSRRRQAEQLRQTTERARLIVFGLIVFAVIAAVGYLLTPLFQATHSSNGPSGAGQVVNLQAGMDGFDLKEIRVKTGEPVTVNLRSLDNPLHSDGGGKHQFAIAELGVNLIAQPLSTNSATFTAPQPGTYTFYCDICCGGKANPTMNGTFIVQAG